MTGDQHYQEAERLLKEPASRSAALKLIERAQAHATLALAAATMDAAFVSDGAQRLLVVDEREGWGYGQ